MLGALNQNVAIKITPATIEKIFESRPDVMSVNVTRTTSVFVIVDCDCPGERFEILSEEAFKTIFEDDLHTLNDWTLLTARTSS